MYHASDCCKKEVGRSHASTVQARRSHASTVQARRKIARLYSTSKEEDRIPQQYKQEGRLHASPVNPCPHLPVPNLVFPHCTGQSRYSPASRRFLGLSNMYREMFCRGTRTETHICNEQAQIWRVDIVHDVHVQHSMALILCIIEIFTCANNGTWSDSVWMHTCCVSLWCLHALSMWWWHHKDVDLRHDHVHILYHLTKNGTDNMQKMFCELFYAFAHVSVWVCACVHFCLFSIFLHVSGTHDRVYSLKCPRV